jgi:hypothetical protein
MSGRDVGRDNLVLSMTLAEIFLLLLFVVWWSSQVPFVIDGQTLTSVQMQERNKELRTKVDTLTTDNARLARELGVLKRLLAIGDSVPVEKFPGAVQDALDAARRGHPKCAEQNVLVDVRMENGVARMTFLQQNAEVLPALSKRSGNRFPVTGVVRTGDRRGAWDGEQGHRDRRARGSESFDYHLGCHGLDCVAGGSAARECSTPEAAFERARRNR